MFHNVPKPKMIIIPPPIRFKGECAELLNFIQELTEFRLQQHQAEIIIALAKASVGKTD